MHTIALYVLGGVLGGVFSIIAAAAIIFRKPLMRHLRDICPTKKHDNSHEQGIGGAANEISAEGGFSMPPTVAASTVDPKSGNNATVLVLDRNSKNSAGSVETCQAHVINESKIESVKGKMSELIGAAHERIIKLPQK